MRIIEKFKQEFNDYGMPWWRSPDFFLLLSGFINIVVMLLSYWWLSNRAEDPREAVPFVAFEAILIMVIGNVVIESTRRVLHSNQMKKEFTDIVSHHLKSPLSSIKWHMEMLLRNGVDNLTSEQKMYLQVVVEADRKMIGLVNDLLNMSNIEKGKSEYFFEEVNIVEIIEEAISSFSLFINSKNIKVFLKKGKNKSILVRADRVRLRVLVDNLLNNAVRYTPEGGNVEINVSKKGKEAVFRIKDSGIGIKNKDQAFVFEKFYRAKEAKRVDAQGTGLGLYIARALVEGMRGRIWFHSTSGQGTTFYFTLPLVKE
jgi:signal transduction histidine kinase